MNLYRSFGNLMEAWVTEDGQCSYSEWLGNNEEDPPTPSSDTGTNLRSESVDSGVETSSSDMSFPATSCSISTENTDIDAFTPERSRASTSQSPVLSSSSSSSPHLCPSRAQEGPVALQQKVEEALQRTNSNCLKHKAEPPTVDEVLRRHFRASPEPPMVDEVLQRQFQASSEPPTVDEVLRRHFRAPPEPPMVDEVLRQQHRASSLPKRHTSEKVRGQRSESFGPRRMVNPVPVRPMRRRPMSMIYDKQPAQTRLEELGEEERQELSPGLNYLEQVCQMLEDFARQQMHSQALQMETDAPREQQAMEVSQPLNTCQGGSRAADEDVSSCQRLEIKQSAGHISTEPQRRKDYRQGHFRQRSASDTTLSTQHLRKLKSDCRGQHLSTDDLLEKLEDDCKKQESIKEESSKTNKNWKLKIGSLGRQTSALKEMNGQQTQSSEKNSARRRLSQLFRRNRRKTLPV